MIFGTVSHLGWT